jgi:hypothetical protein
MVGADRFPDDFMFVFDKEKTSNLRFQSGTSKSEPRGGTQYPPMVFTEQSVAMLSGVLNSSRAVQVNNY